MEVLARQLHEHLPFLRRYARALTGLTDRGDDLVTRAVEVAMMAPQRFGVADGSRVPLYALINLLFDDDHAGQGRPANSSHPIERALAALAEADRRVYLLSALENLAVADVALVMQMPPADAGTRLVRTREAVRDALTQRVLVVEDNALVAMEIGSVIAGMGHVVCGTAANGREALELAEAERPTLALLDVRLANGDSGVQIARQLRRQKTLRTIFVTGYDSDLEELDARHLGQVVRKPFTKAAITAAVSRAVFMPSPVALA